jgi:fructosamine-3-kinase
VRIAGVEVAAAQPVHGGDICRAWVGTCGASSARKVFAKTLADAPTGLFAAEARGLDLLRVDGGPPVPSVIAVDDDGLVLQWVEPAPPTPGTARDFGRRLAALHTSWLPSFGAAADGFIGPLPLPNAAMGPWSEFYVERRLRPFMSALSTAERVVVEEVCARIDEIAGEAEPPARIHGDLWSGNVLWADSSVWLVDAASAHGGHRETDLAMLALFGVPHFDEILSGYREIAPLGDGWRDRVPLHQLHPLLVHATLFGGGYGARAASAARSLLR